MSQHSTTIWLPYWVRPSPGKQPCAPSYVRRQGPTVCLEQRLSDKGSTRHSKASWFGLNRVMHSFCQDKA